MVDDEEVTTEKSSPRWFIDFDWYQQSNRSLFTLTQHCLCPKCRERLVAGKTEISASDLLSTIRDCCSQDPEFINSRLPVMESVFRLILANGNRPLDLEELGDRLRERLGGDTYRTSPEVLSRLLGNDRYYGLRQVTES